MSRILNYLFLIIIAFFALGQLQRLEIAPGIAVYGHDLLIMLWLSIYAATRRAQLFQVLKRAAARIFKTPLLSALIIWVLIGMLWSILSVQPPTITPFLYLARALTYLLFAYLSAKSAGKGTAQGYWIIAGLLVLLLGLLQYMFLPDVRFLYLYGWDDHYFRLVGSMLDPAFTGMMLVLCFSYINLHYPKLKKLHAATLLAVAIGIVLTYSRSSYLALIPVLGVLIAREFSKKALKVAIPALLILGLVYAVAPKPGGSGVNLLRTDTLEARAKNISLNLSSLSPKTLLIGEGLFSRVQNTSEKEFGISHAAVPDNLFLMLLKATGVPGLILSAYFLVKFGVYLFRQDQMLFSAFASLILHSQFNNTLLQPFVLLYFLGGLMSAKTLE